MHDLKLEGVPPFLHTLHLLVFFFFVAAVVVDPVDAELAVVPDAAAEDAPPYFINIVLMETFLFTCFPFVFAAS